MLAARGVSLGLGKINLSELNVLPSDRAFLGRLRRKKKAQEAKYKIIIKKHVDKKDIQLPPTKKRTTGLGHKRKRKSGVAFESAHFPRSYVLNYKKTLWVACRMAVVGGITMLLGLLMTVLGYFDRDLTTTLIYNTTLGTTMSIVDDSLRYKLKSMQYIGPILMGFGMFLLIICCVITLESRDKHAQIIQQENNEYRRKSKLSMSGTKTSLLSPTTEQEQFQAAVAKENGQASEQVAPVTSLISESHTSTKPFDVVAVKAEVHPQKCLTAPSSPVLEQVVGLRTVYNIVNYRTTQRGGRAPIVRVESVVELSMATPLSHSGSGSTLASI